MSTGGPLCAGVSRSELRWSRGPCRLRRPPSVGQDPGAPLRQAVSTPATPLQRYYSAIAGYLQSGLVQVRGTDPQEIFAQLGRYGPYISKQKDSRSLESEEQIFTVTVPEAQALFAQPRRRGGALGAPGKPGRGRAHPA